MPKCLCKFATIFLIWVWPPRTKFDLKSVQKRWCANRQDDLEKSGGWSLTCALISTYVHILPTLDSDSFFDLSQFVLKLVSLRDQFVNGVTPLSFLQDLFFNPHTFPPTTNSLRGEFRDRGFRHPASLVSSANLYLTNSCSRQQRLNTMEGNYLQPTTTTTTATITTNIWIQWSGSNHVASKTSPQSPRSHINTSISKYLPSVYVDWESISQV